MISNIVILGNGNVATHLSEALLNAGYSVVQRWARGEALRDADLYLIAVSDDAIEEVAALIPDGKPFAHTSGSAELARGGVFYPLQTFSKNIDVDWEHIPILIEASDKPLEDMLLSVAHKISTNVHLMNAANRRQLHLAAVFACNFTNHLWAVSEDLLSAKGISFDLLKPLIYQTFRKIENHSPRDVQTGPAIRNDAKTLAQHRKLLDECKGGVHPPPSHIYDIISKSIQQHHGSH